MTPNVAAITAPALVLLVLAGCAAAVDWWSVYVDRKHVEYVAKPAVLVLLIAAAVVLVPADPAIRAWFVVGLAFGLLGDILLMFDRFIPGAAAFLIGHLAYIVGLLRAPQHAWWLLLGLVLFAALVVAVGRRIVAAAVTRDKTLGVIVAVYLLALGTVLVLGVGTAVPLAVAGVLLFSTSDALLAYGRFVGPAPGGRVAVHVTYHLAQGLLVLSLLQLAP